jgi:dipeptidyl aminopeptidase/acylaminoacyl peptidase
MNAVKPAEICLIKENEERIITDFNKNLINSVKFVEPERYIFKNNLGQDVDAWVIKPENFQSGKKYPAILEIHGGPTSVYGDNMNFEFQVLASEGFVVYYTNPRGSGGYGEEYTASQQGDYGGVDLDDLNAVVDDAISRYDFIDPRRLGVIGGSYGGSIVNLWITRSRRFKAAIACRSLSNSISAHGTGVSGWRHGKSGRMGFPWEDPEHLLEISPLVHADKIKTPLLLIHSELDIINRVTEPEQLLVALRELGKEAELLVFPNQGHPLPRSGRPKHREERLQQIVNWFKKYV